MHPTRRTIRQRMSLLALILFSAFMFASTPTPAHMQGGSNQPAYTANFTDLSFSTSSGGTPMTYFPVGTTQIFARWNFYNVPDGPGITLLRQWYLNGKLFIEKQEPWNSAWGLTGRLTHISIYDFTEGLTPGYYHVVISLMYDYPAAQVVGDFAIAAYPPTVVPPTSGAAFTGLTVSTSASGPDMLAFPAGTTVVSARWNYANIPIGAMLQRDWYYNGVLFRSVQEPWSAYWGSSGRLTHIAIYDYERGLAPGNYRLIVFLRDNPAVRAETAFSIGSVNDPQPDGPTLFYNLTFSGTPTGPASAIFPHGTPVVYARWDFNFVSPQSIVLRRWYRNGALWLERQEPWTRGTSGSVRDISIYDYQSGLLPGDYYVEISLIGFPNSLIRGYFTIQ
jgi:hypothetical protein